MTAANATAACAFCSAKVTVSYQSQHHLNDCAADQFHCSGGCYPITCGMLAMLTTGAAPTILLSAQAKAALNSSLELIVTYATPVAFNLLPCPSTGRPYHQAHHCLLLSVMLHLSLSFAIHPPCKQVGRPTMVICSCMLSSSTEPICKWVELKRAGKSET